MNLIREERQFNRIESPDPFLANGPKFTEMLRMDMEIKNDLNWYKDKYIVSLQYDIDLSSDKRREASAYEYFLCPDGWEWTNGAEEAKYIEDAFLFFNSIHQASKEANRHPSHSYYIWKFEVVNDSLHLKCINESVPWCGILRIWYKGDDLFYYNSNDECYKAHGFVKLSEVDKL